MDKVSAIAAKMNWDFNSVHVVRERREGEKSAESCSRYFTRSPSFLLARQS
ncbi:hypothetical protein Hanom_Chr04g00333161 [Helianthus anomalus]